jgi:hypothetical protein
VIVDVLRMILVAALVILAGLIATGRIQRFFTAPSANKTVKAQDGLFWQMVLMGILVALGEVLWSPIKCLAIPVFLVGSCYVMYDAFLRKR